MNAGLLRLEASFSATWADDERLLTCESRPELCADEPLPDHVRSQTFSALRWDLGASIGLGKGLQVGLSLPIIVKSFGIEHTLTNGAPYEVPYYLLTGPSETQVGLGDAEVLVRLIDRVPGVPLLLSAGVGAALPTGRISENPFDPQVPASRREQRQFGNGTVDPRVELGLVVESRPIGFVANGSARFPVYANKYGYQGRLSVTGSFGVVTSAPHPGQRLRLLALLQLTHTSPAKWDGEPALNSGGDSLGVRLGFEYVFKKKIGVRAGLLAMPLQNLRGDQFAAPVTLSVGVSGVIDVAKAVKKKKEKAGHGH